MKIQISRDGYRPDKRYSGVYQQQGRMITDRDWNELVDILKTRLDEGLADVVGSGLPRGRAVELFKGSQGPEIRPGVVYAGGVAARVASASGDPAPFRYGQQADFPSPPPLPANQPYFLYADVWDRPVSALEDEGLRDPALNGADTTARTQTMAQIKWAPATRDSESPAYNPARGNGTLSVSVPAASSDGPLGEADTVGGDYLLRLEVHDVTWATNALPNAPGRLVVKWSRENGAEQHKALEAPSSFKIGPWIYELYEPASEKSLGYHFAASWQPPRGALINGFPFLTPQNHQNHLIRRWDGYCVLYQTNKTWTFSPNQPDDVRKTAPGATVLLDSGRLTVRLIDLELTLDLQDKVFLPGDYWQVPVRRAVHQPGATIVQAAQPAGITHRYVTLASVSATGDVTPAASTFPPLSGLLAGDVGYDGSGATNGLFNSSHDTVEKALDRLGGLAAEHVAYAKPADASLYKGKTVTNARNALDLLSDVRASQIVYEGRAGLPDVQAALDELYTRPGGDACGFTVGTGGEFSSLETAIQTLLTQQRVDIRLMLLPGNHELTSLGYINSTTQPVHLTLHGVGWSSRLVVKRQVTFDSLASVTIQGLAIEFEGTFANFSPVSGELNFLDNRISGVSSTGLIFPSSNSRFLFRDNLVEVSLLDPAQEPVAILSPLDTEASVRELFLTRSPRLFALRAGQIIAKLRALTDAERESRVKVIQANLDQRTSVPKATYDTVIANVRAGASPTLAALLATVRAEALQRARPGVFLNIVTPNIPVRLEGNQIFGYVALYGNLAADLNEAELVSFGNRVANVTFQSSDTSELIAVGNRMSGFRVGSTMLDTIRSSSILFPLFQRIVLTDNTFDASGNQVIACNVELVSNLYTATPFGWAIGEETLFLSNVARTDINLDTVARNVVQAGNSSRVRIRRVGTIS